MNTLTDILKSDPYSIELSRIDDCIAHLVALRSVPKYWTHEWLDTLKAMERLIRSDALEGEIAEAAHAVTPCEDCHRVNCICDYPYEERVSASGYGVGL